MSFSLREDDPSGSGPLYTFRRTALADVLLVMQVGGEGAIADVVAGAERIIGYVTEVGDGAPHVLFARFGDPEWEGEAQEIAERPSMRFVEHPNFCEPFTGLVSVAKL